MAHVRRRPEWTECFVETGRGRLYVLEVGHGLPVVVVHGGPDFDHRYMRPELDRLARSFRLIYYDQRGRGRSFFGEGAEDVSMASEVDDLDRVRATLGLDRVAVLGHSWGGLLAIEYALRHHAYVSHLILLHTAPVSRAGWRALGEELERRRTPDQIARLAALQVEAAYRKGDFDADAEYYRIHYSAMLDNDVHLERLVGSLRAAFTSEGIVAARAIEDRLWEETVAAESWNLIPQLGRLGMPTLVIHGARDVVPLEVATEIAHAMPAAQLVVLSDCGHFSYLEHPELLDATITEFLTTHSPSPA